MTTPDGAGPAPSVSTGALFLVILTFAVAFNTLSLTVIPEGRPLRIACAALPIAALLWTAVAVWHSRGVPGAALHFAQGKTVASGQWSILGLGLLAVTGAAISTFRTGAR